MQVLTEGLLKSGLTMTVLGGESSPSSGAEHVISHFWDWQAHMEGRQHHLHGYQVGIATLISHAIYDLILRIPANNLNSLLSSPRRPVLERILGEIDKRFGNNGEEFKQVAARKYLSDNDYDEYLENLVHRWDEIQAAVSVYITPVTHIHTSYREAGMDISLGAIARSKEDAVDALLFGSRYRIRYTVLDLAWDLGIFPDAVDEVLARAGVLN
jgi:glycerol-1-phosphate dehydrogenase [NAD(P)+]